MDITYLPHIQPILPESHMAYLPRARVQARSKGTALRFALLSSTSTNRNRAPPVGPPINSFEYLRLGRRFQFSLTSGFTGAGCLAVARVSSRPVRERICRDRAAGLILQ